MANPIAKKALAISALALLMSGFRATAATDAQSLEALPPRDPNRPVALFVLDMLGDGYEFTSKADGVTFDVDGTAKPIQIGWTKAGSDEGFLFLDTNGNGRVDNGRELIGNGWRKDNGTRVYGGDEALNVIQGLDGNLPLGPVSKEMEHYAWIDSKNEAFSRLRVWCDTNHNGVSEPTELRTMGQANILKIFVGFALNKRVQDPTANTQLMVGTFYLNPPPGCIRQPGAPCEVARRMPFMEFAR